MTPRAHCALVSPCAAASPSRCRLAWSASLVAGMAFLTSAVSSLQRLGQARDCAPAPHEATRSRCTKPRASLGRNHQRTTSALAFGLFSPQDITKRTRNTVTLTITRTSNQLMAPPAPSRGGGATTLHVMRAKSAGDHRDPLGRDREVAHPRRVARALAQRLDPSGRPVAALAGPRLLPLLVRGRVRGRQG